MLTVLIGPPGSGKSTVGALVAQTTARPFVEADVAGTPWYAGVGWTVRRLWERAAEVGFERAHREWEVALVAAVEGLTGGNPHAVLALGAGHTHVTTPYRVLERRCRETKGHAWEIEGVDWLRRWLEDGRDERLATDLVITQGEAAARTAGRLAARCRGGDRPA